MEPQKTYIKEMKRKPRYLVARKLLIDLILKENYKINEILPSINTLTASFRLGRFPIQQAVKLLAEEGILRNVLGSGCYIKKLPELSKSETEAKSASKAPTIDIDSWNYITAPGNAVSPKKIRLGLFPEMPEQILLWEKLIAQYMKKHPSIKIEIIQLDFPSMMFDHAIFQNIDLFQIPIYLLPFFVESGLLFDLDEIGEIPFSSADFYDSIIQASYYKNKIYGVPIITSIIVQFYNKKYEKRIKDFFPIRGFWNYMEKLEAYSKKIKDKDYDFLITNTESLFTLSMLTKAKENPSYEDKKKFNSPDFVQFIERFQKYYTNTQIFDCEIDFRIALNRFLNGKSILFTASTSSIPEILEKCPFQLKMMPQVIEPEGARRLDGNLTVISASTPFPEECLDILNYFSQYETQLFLAQNGRFVAHKKANESLVIKGLEQKNITDILQSFDQTKIIHTKDPYIDEYIRTIANHEIQKWQQKDFSNNELISSLKRKTDFYYRSKLRIHNNFKTIPNKMDYSPKTNF